MKLVDDWRRAPKWISMRAAVAGMALLGAWSVMPEDLKASLPAWATTGTAVGILVLVAVGRLVKQTPTLDDDEDKAP